MNKQNCIVCNGNLWLMFPTPNHVNSVRSDGAILNFVLSKAQCKHCGLVQSINLPDIEALTTLYMDSYDIYNYRPASEQFVAGRYKALAEAFTAAVEPFNPKHVLEVGCGNGAALQAMQSVWKDARCVGIEPVSTAVNAAQKEGINVYQGMVGVEMPSFIMEQKYDVIYAIHVIEHTKDPVAFLKELKKLLSPQGHLLISCPNSCIPNLEIMRTDHHYSMTPYHLEVLTRKAGLVPIKNVMCPGGAENLDYEHNQLLVSCLTERDQADVMLSIHLPDYLNDANRIKLYESRKEYFQKFGVLDKILQQQITNYKHIFCFGTGGWACILAGYAPNTWSKIEACVIDGGSDQKFHGKDIYAYEDLKSLDPDSIIIGTNPAIQSYIAQRLKKDGYKTLCWDTFIPR